MIGGGEFDLVADRYGALPLTMSFAQLDLTGITMEAQIRATKDASGSPLVDLLTVTTSATQGLKLVGVWTDTVANHIAAGRLSSVPKGLTSASSIVVSVVYLQVNQSTNTALPAEQQVGDDVELYWDLAFTIGGLKQIWLRGKYIVRAGVTH
jgi:hypothetical protein